MRALRWIALILMIRAVFPASEDIMDAVQLLREAAIKAGCPDPRVAMRSLGGDKGIEVEVRCPREGE